jgi:hypothetical protein
MLTKPLLVALLAACGVNSTGATSPAEQLVEQPDKAPPDDDVEDGQHFCCQSLGEKSGDGCTFIADKQAALCDKLLYCAGSYKKDGDTVTCIE